jgi:hypothetical protein
VNAAELREEIALELDALRATVSELDALQQDLAERVPTVREKAAAAAFLAQFYNGSENILKRISRYHDVPLPTGETWHTDLFQRFCSPPHPDLPLLFDDALAADLAPYRRFRHVAFHSYGFQLDWGRMAEGAANAENVFERLEQRLTGYLNTIGA